MESSCISILGQFPLPTELVLLHSYQLKQGTFFLFLMHLFLNKNLHIFMIIVFNFLKKKLKI